MTGSTVSGVALDQVSVRPVRDAAERARWDRLMDKHHCLGFRGMFGGGLRHVALAPDGQWLALIGWCSGAFKVAARDRWIGWTRQQQFRRLPLVANNTRFLVLPQARQPNLASRALSLSLRRLSSDMLQRHGHPVLLAETFVDPSRFKGVCYLASNWHVLGQTRGYARASGGWVAHGQPKQVLVRPLGRDVRQVLSGLAERPEWGLKGEVSPPCRDAARRSVSCAREPRSRPTGVRPRPYSA